MDDAVRHQNLRHQSLCGGRAFLDTSGRDVVQPPGRMDTAQHLTG
jgi:hypothetical protein